MASWADLDDELRLWRAAGEIPTFWWRDDDTEAPTADLERLIALAERFSAPLHLAVVPHAIDPGLAPRLGASPLVYALQHGFSHKNHEPKGARASEVGVNRDIALQEADLTLGWQPRPRWHLFAQSFSVWSLDDPRPGVREFEQHKLQVSIGREIGQLEYHLGAALTPAGRNSIEERSVFLSVWRRF